MITLTLRRYYIDDFLNLYKPLMKGRVLDVGGKKENKRGFFRPPLKSVESWEYLNIDMATSPDYACSVYKLPFAENTFDTIIFCEILEHLNNPEAALLEIFRILKPSGKVIITVPFLYALHADPEDYQRWTDEKIKSELLKAGFAHVEIKPMGGVFAVIFDLIHFAIERGLGTAKLLSRAIYKIYHLFGPVFKYLDRGSLGIRAGITTGYFSVAFKK